MATIYYTASSLDGLIAAPGDDDLTWLTSRDIDGEGPEGYDAFRANVGAMALGATTYQWVLDHEDGAWPFSLPCWVFTHRELPLHPDVRLTADPVADVHAAMVAQAGGRDVWLVGGGELVGQFVDAGLLDEIRVQYAPALLGGQGSPLLPRRLDLGVISIERNNEFAVARYAVRKGKQPLSPPAARR